MPSVFLRALPALVQLKLVMQVAPCCIWHMPSLPPSGPSMARTLFPKADSSFDVAGYKYAHQLLLSMLKEESYIDVHKPGKSNHRACPRFACSPNRCFGRGAICMARPFHCSDCGSSATASASAVRRRLFDVRRAKSTPGLLNGVFGSQLFQQHLDFRIRRPTMACSWRIEKPWFRLAFGARLVSCEALVKYYGLKRTRPATGASVSRSLRSDGPSFAFGVAF